MGRRSPGMVDHRDLSLWRIFSYELRYEGSPGLWHLILWIAHAHLSRSLCDTRSSGTGIRHRRRSLPHLLCAVPTAAALAAGLQLLHGVPVRGDRSPLYLASAILLSRGLLLPRPATPRAHDADTGPACQPDPARHHHCWLPWAGLSPRCHSCVAHVRRAASPALLDLYWHHGAYIPFHRRHSEAHARH